MGNTSRTSLHWDEEATYGVLPGTPAFNDFRTTGDSLKTEKETETSDEIRNDRQNVDVIEISQSAGGSIPSEYSMNTHDDHIEAGIGSAAAASEVTVANSLSVTVVAATGIFSTGAWTVNPTAGKWVRVEGMVASGNNGYFKVKASPAPSGTEFAVEQIGSLSNEGATASVTILQGAQAVNGIAERTFTYERRHADLSNIFEQYYGSFINGFTFTFPAKGKATIEYDILGQKETSTSATVANTNVPANEFNVLSAANNLKFAWIDFTSICLMTGSLTTNNNGNVDTICAGEKFPEEQTIGDFNVTAELGILFADHTHKDVFLAHTSVNFSMAWEDAGGRGMVMEILAAKFTDEATPVEGKSQKLIETLTLEGLMDSTEDIMFRYTTFTT